MTCLSRTQSTILQRSDGNYKQTFCLYILYKICSSSNEGMALILLQHHQTLAVKITFKSVT